MSGVSSNPASQQPPPGVVGPPPVQPPPTPGAGGGGLFANLKYFVTGDVSDEVKVLLKEGGGKREFYVSDLVSHVITENTVEEEYRDKLTIRAAWVKLSYQLGYLLPTQPFTVFPTGLLSSCTISTTGIKGDDYYALWSMVRWNGGTVSNKLSQKTTHLIVGGTQNLHKYKAALTHHIPVVVVEWLVESIEMNALQPTENYTLFIPGITPPRQPSVAAPPASVPPPQLQQPPPQPPPPQMPVVPPPPPVPPQVLHTPSPTEEKRKRTPKKQTKKKKAESFPASSAAQRQSALMMANMPGQQQMPGQGGIPGQIPGQMNGGMIGGGPGYPHTPSPLPPTPSPHSPDRFALQQQQQNPYMMANANQYLQYQQSGMPVRYTGPPPNATARPQWSMYQQQMMQKQGYYPPYPGQFTAQQQAQAQGRPPYTSAPPPPPQGPLPPQPATPLNYPPTKAVPTPPPDPVTTPVPAAVSSNNAPPETKESRYSTLKNCVLMLIDYPEYYSRDIMSKWKVVIEEHGGEVASFYNPAHVTHIICMSRMSDIYKRAVEDGKCVTTAHWLNDIVISKEYSSPCNPLHIPTQFRTGLPDCAKMKISVTGYEGKERINVKDMIRLIGAVYTGELSQQNTHLISRKSDGLKFAKAQKWGTKVVNARWLSDIVIYGVVSVTTEKKYTVLGDPKEMVLNDTVMPKLMECWHRSPAQRTKFQSPVVLFTGLPSDKNQKLTQMLKRMKCRLTSDVREATHLVTCKIVRTVKFLAAMSQCRFILTPSWVEQSCTRKMLIDEMNFILDDKESEASLGFCVKDSLVRARSSKVFAGIELFLTPHIQPGPKDMRVIVECGGGTILGEEQALARMNQPPQTRPNFYVVSCSPDQMISQQFYQRSVQIYTSEFVLSSVLSQQIDFESNKLFASVSAPAESGGGGGEGGGGESTPKSSTAPGTPVTAPAATAS